MSVKIRVCDISIPLKGQSKWPVSVLYIGSLAFQNVNQPFPHFDWNFE